MSVVSLKGDPIVAPGTPNADLVTHLEEILEKARSGEISSLVYIALYHDDLTTYHWIGRMTRGVLGCLELVKYGLSREDAESK